MSCRHENAEAWTGPDGSGFRCFQCALAYDDTAFTAEQLAEFRQVVREAIREGLAPLREAADSILHAEPKGDE